MAICRTKTIELENLETKSIERKGWSFSNGQNFPVHLEIDVGLDTYPLHVVPDSRAVWIESDACIVTQAPQQLSLDLCAEG